MRFEMIMIIGSVVLLALLFYVSMKNPAKNRLTKIIRFILAVILLVVFFVYAVKEFGPRGRNPIFSDAGRGENTGEDTVQTSPGQELVPKGQEIIDIVISKILIIICQSRILRACPVKGIDRIIKGE